MKKISLLMTTLYLIFTVNCYARQNGLDGTVLMYFNGLGVSDDRYIKNIKALKETLTTPTNKLNSIDSDVAIDGVWTGGEVAGSEFLSKYSAIRIYKSLLEKQGNIVLGNRLVDELGNILFAKKITPASEWTFSDEINLQLGELQLLFHTYDPFVQDMVNVITKTGNYINSNKRIISLAHSQGSMYDNQTYTTLNNTTVIKDKLGCQFGSFHQGSAVPSILNPNGSYVTVENDALAKELETWFLPYLAPNYRIEDPPADVIKGNFHELLSTYYNASAAAIFLGSPNSEEFSGTGTMPDIAIYKLAKLADKMDENCSSCDNPEPTCTSDNSQIYINADGSEGGLIGNCVQVIETDLWIDPGAEVCGKTIIRPESYGQRGFVQVLNESKVHGETQIYSSAFAPVIIQNKAIVTGVAFNDLSYQGTLTLHGVERGEWIKDNAKLNGLIHINDSIIGGDAQLSTLPNDRNYIFIYNSVIQGNAKLSLNVNQVNNSLFVENSIIEGNSNINSSTIYNSWIKDNSSIHSPHGWIDYLCMMGTSSIRGQGSDGFTGHVSNVVMINSNFLGNTYVEGGYLNGYTLVDGYYEHEQPGYWPCVSTDRELALNTALDSIKVVQRPEENH